MTLTGIDDQILYKDGLMVVLERLPQTILRCIILLVSDGNEDLGKRSGQNRCESFCAGTKGYLSCKWISN